MITAAQGCSSARRPDAWRTKYLRWGVGEGESRRVGETPGERRRKEGRGGTVLLGTVGFGDSAA